MKISAWKFNLSAADQPLAWIEGMKEKLAVELLNVSRVGSMSCEQFFYKGHVDWAGYQFMIEDSFTVLACDSLNCKWREYTVPFNDPKIAGAYVKQYVGEDASFIILDNKVTVHTT